MFLTYKSSNIHYISFGNGKEYLLAFHGYNESAESLRVLEPSLTEQFTVLAMDIPYHGKTEWNEVKHFSTDDFIAIIKIFIETYQIKIFSVFGFSMGGKCALYTVAAYAEKINRVFLLASDGIKTNKVYNVAVYPKWGRELFKTTIKHPRWFFTFIKTAKALGLISPWLYKFTINHFDTKPKRQRLYDTWMSMSRFNPNIAEIKQKLNTYQVQTFLFFGKRDEVIPLKVAEYFADGLAHCSLTILERGHYFIDHRLNAFITQALEKK